MANFVLKYSVFVAALFLYSCKTTEVKETSEVKASICQSPIEVSQYLKQSRKCLQPGIFKTQWEDSKRQLYSWVPCNQVKWIDSSIDLFGGNDTQLEALRQSTNKKIYHHLGEDKPNLVFEGKEGLDKIKKILANPSTTPSYLPSVVLEGEIAKNVLTMIQEAQSHIFVDIFLLGGTWGIEIARQLALASQRGVEVLLLHDTVSYFTVKNEMANLWTALLEHSKTSSNFKVMPANISPPLRPSSIPMGLEQITKVIDDFTDVPVSVEGRSDHSKVIITDAMPSSKKGLAAKVLISSRNMVNSASSFYHDEAVIVEGPAAVLAMMQYYPDIFWAKAEQLKEEKLSKKTISHLNQVWVNPLWTMRQGPHFTKSAGETSVLPLAAASS